MQNWSLHSEYFAVILDVLLILFYYDPHQTSSSKKNLYWGCLFLSLFSILINILSVYTLNNPGLYSVMLRLLIVSLYFIVSCTMCVCITYYLFNKIYEYLFDKSGLRITRKIMAATLLFYTALILWNLKSGVLFFIDEADVYCRGPLNFIVYVEPVLAAAALFVGFFKHRRSVSTGMGKIMLISPPVVLLLVLYQLAFPEQLLNGTMSAVVNLIMFVSLQSCSIEKDSLTGLGNHRSFVEELSLRVAGKQEFQIIIVSLRHFSNINNIYGREGGDHLLKLAAGSLEKLAGNDAALFRYSSAGFLMMLPGADAESCSVRLDNIMSQVEKNWRYGSSEIEVAYCITELIYRGQPWTYEEIIGYIDYAIAHAKHENLPVIHIDAELENNFKRREYLLSQMKKAISGDGARFEVWYQPIYNKACDDFVSAEALVRLFDEENNLVSPAEFIPLAEESDLIDKITEIILNKVCCFLGSNRIPELEKVSVNVTMRQLLQKDLRERVLEVVNRHETEPKRLKLEITERVLAENITMVSETMKAMKEIDIEFLLDDFGTGYSNLSNVLNLPFATVKLDKSLMDGLENDERARIMANTIIPFFHKLNMSVLAEGIETAQQARMILLYGADLIQGYYYARPMPEDKLYSWYEKKRKKLLCIGE